MKRACGPPAEASKHKAGQRAVSRVKKKKPEARAIPASVVRSVAEQGIAVRTIVVTREGRHDHTGRAA